MRVFLRDQQVDTDTLESEVFEDGCGVVMHHDLPCNNVS